MNPYGLNPINSIDGNSAGSVATVKLPRGRIYSRLFFALIIAGTVTPVAWPLSTPLEMRVGGDTPLKTTLKRFGRIQDARNGNNLTGAAAQFGNAIWNGRSITFPNLIDPGAALAGQTSVFSWNFAQDARADAADRSLWLGTADAEVQILVTIPNVAGVKLYVYEQSVPGIAPVGKIRGMIEKSITLNGGALDIQDMPSLEYQSILFDGIDSADALRVKVGDYTLVDESQIEGLIPALIGSATGSTTANFFSPLGNDVEFAIAGTNTTQRHLPFDIDERLSSSLPKITTVNGVLTRVPPPFITIYSDQAGPRNVTLAMEYLYEFNGARA